MRQSSLQNMNDEITQVEKTATVLIRKIRDAILDDVFKPGDHLAEVELAARDNFVKPRGSNNNLYR